MTITNTLGAKFVGQFMDMELAFASGSIGPTFTCHHLFGENPAAGTSWQDVWITGGVYSWPQTAGAVSIVSASTNDTATGIGARTVIVEGLDANFRNISETITVTGQLTATGARLFRRVNKIYVEHIGTYDGSTVASHGAITATHLGTATAKIEVSVVSFGRTELARYTVPDGHTAYVNEVDINVDSTKFGSVIMFARENADVTTAPFTAKQAIEIWEGLSGPYSHSFNAPQRFPAKTDIWFVCKAAQAATPMNVSFDIFLTPE